MGGSGKKPMDLLKNLYLISSDAPTTDELEVLKNAKERVGMVIRARWVLLGILALYGIAAFIIFQHSTSDVSQITPVSGIVAILAFSAVAAYNAWYQYSYEWLSKIRSLNAIQLLFDLFLVTVVVHFSGGVVSWFWTMYMVLTLEAALIMDKRSDTYAIAMAGSIAFGGLLTFEFHGLIPPVPMPFENNGLQQTFSYEMIKWAWVSITNFCIAFVGVFMMDSVRQREAEMRELAVRDALTALYNRRYFFYRLNSEIQRAKRYGRTLSLLILDVDDFKKFNDKHGHLGGDNLLRGLAERIKGAIRRSETTPSYEVDIACRYGGEEFAVILPEAVSVEGAAAAERIRASIEMKGAIVVAERIRERIEQTQIGGIGVTVSIGVASYPAHGKDLDVLVKAADDALFKAKGAGKNQVIVAGDPFAFHAGGDVPLPGDDGRNTEAAV
jgi:diguanylate cyclase (GGDEF)-like protein